MEASAELEAKPSASILVSCAFQAPGAAVEKLSSPSLRNEECRVGQRQRRRAIQLPNCGLCFPFELRLPADGAYRQADGALMDRLLALRESVGKVLEPMRAEGRIGASLAA